MLAEIRAKKPFNGQRARLTVDGARPSNSDGCVRFISQTKCPNFLNCSWKVGRELQLIMATFTYSRSSYEHFLLDTLGTPDTLF